MSAREMRSVSWASQPIDDAPANQEALITWLNGRGAQHTLRFALVHADDGVIWGVFDGSVWRWSGDAAPDVSPKLRWLTLQQMRLFGASAEVFVWRSGEMLKGRVITDSEGGSNGYFEEAQLLWGYRDRDKCEQKAEFCLMREGAQGLVHAPPVEIAREGKLTTRNYIEYDKNGCAFVKASRLVMEAR